METGRFEIVANCRESSIEIVWDAYPNAAGYCVLSYDLKTKQYIEFGDVEWTRYVDCSISENDLFKRYYQVAAYNVIAGERKYLAFSNTIYLKKKIVPIEMEEDDYSEDSFDKMEGHEFERFCAALLLKNGFEKVTVTPGSGDQGVDVLAYKEGIKYGIQCKCYSSDIGNKAVQEAYAGKTFYDCHVGVVLTNRWFTASARELARKNNILLWDRQKLLALIEADKGTAQKPNRIEKAPKVFCYETSENLFFEKYGKEQLFINNNGKEDCIDIANAQTDSGTEQLHNIQDNTPSKLDTIIFVGLLGGILMEIVLPVLAFMLESVLSDRTWDVMIKTGFAGGGIAVLCAICLIIKKRGMKNGTY